MKIRKGYTCVRGFLQAEDQAVINHAEAGLGVKTFD